MVEMVEGICYLLLRELRAIVFFDGPMRVGLSFFMGLYMKVCSYVLMSYMSIYVSPCF